MTYEIQTIPITKYPAIAALPIINQGAIVQKFGSPLELTRVIELIRDSTSGYSLDLPLAKEADALLMKLIAKKGFEVKAKQEPKPLTAPKSSATKPAFKVGDSVIFSNNRGERYQGMSAKVISVEMDNPTKGMINYQIKIDYNGSEVGCTNLDLIPNETGKPLPPTVWYSMLTLAEDCAIALEALEGDEKIAMQELLDDTELALSVL